jgi:hypothetical protein
MFRINWNNDQSTFTLSDLNSTGGTFSKIETPTSILHNMVISVGD